MNTRAVNVVCLLLLVGLAIWSLWLWFHDGRQEPAIYAAIWSLVAPAVVRALTSL